MKFVSFSAMCLPIRTQGVPPRENAPKSPRFGPYCFKAVCSLRKKNVQTEDLIDQFVDVGRFTGYDVNMTTISKSVARACTDHCHRLKNGKLYMCSEPSVTMLTSNIDRPCEGELFFEFEGKVKRLL